MAYDRYDSRDLPRDDRSRWRDERDDKGGSARREPAFGRDDRNRGGREERGFFERAGDEIASWFGDEDPERRRRYDQSGQAHEPSSGADYGRRDRGGYRGEQDRDRSSGARGSHDDWNDDRSAFSPRRDSGRRYERGWREPEQDSGRDHRRNENWNDNRGVFASGGSSERDYDRDRRQDYSGRDFNPRRADGEMDRGWTDRYRPIAGDYARSGHNPPRDTNDEARSQSKWAEDEYRGTSRAGSANWSDRSREDRSDRSRQDRFDPHYRSWRDRHLDELDRDYDDYRAENSSRFESDFGSWRERRQQKRALLGQIREQMEVVGNDGKTVGKVDRTAGDRLILAGSDSESGGIHHSISCSDIDRVEGERVILDCTADQARSRWRDESRGRALFERDDNGEMGPRVLDRSFGGTYR